MVQVLYACMDQTSHGIQKNGLYVQLPAVFRVRRRCYVRVIEVLAFTADDQQKEKSAEIRKKMADALSGFSSNELTVTQKNGKVYVSLSENLLFPSGSADVNVKGKDALSKLAAVLIINPDISVNIEGHTDSIPIRSKFQDNWALSTARSTAIVRILVDTYHVDPIRVIASGHSQYDPVESNSTQEGRAKNRRTEIILSPKLDELYKLLGT